MAKYSYEFKKKVVDDYLAGMGGFTYLAKKYSIPQCEIVRRWVNAYQTFGTDGLVRSRKNNEYSFEFKLRVVELYLSSEVSYHDLALSQGIINPGLVVKWVNDFRIAGPDALRAKKKGRKKTLDKTNKKTIIPMDAGSDNISAERVKELENELLKLRIENAFLKELRRLRLGDEAKMKDLQKSSAVSEDSLN